MLSFHENPNVENYALNLRNKIPFSCIESEITMIASKEFLAFASGNQITIINKVETSTKSFEFGN